MAEKPTESRRQNTDGFHTYAWGNSTRLQCDSCPYDTDDKAQMLQHQREQISHPKPA